MLIDEGVGGAFKWDKFAQQLKKNLKWLDIYPTPPGAHHVHCGETANICWHFSHGDTRLGIWSAIRSVWQPSGGQALGTAESFDIGARGARWELSDHPVTTTIGDSRIKFVKLFQRILGGFLLTKFT